jgi:hypothetical protein
MKFGGAILVCGARRNLAKPSEEALKILFPRFFK